MNGSGLWRGTVAVAGLCASLVAHAVEADASFEELARESAARYSAILSISAATPPLRWSLGDALFLDGRSTRALPPSRMSALQDPEPQAGIPSWNPGLDRADELRWIPWEAPCLPVPEPSAAAMMVAGIALLPALLRRMRARGRRAG